MADIPKAVADRLEKLEKFREEALPNMWLVHSAKAVIGLLAAAALGALITAIWGLISFASWLGALGADVRNHADRIAHLQQAQETVAAKQEAHYVHLVELLSKHWQVGSLFVEGTLDKIDGNKLALKTETGTEHFVVTAETSITLGGKKALPTDLKPGMKLRLVPAENGSGKVISIENIPVESGKGKQNLPG